MGIPAIHSQPLLGGAGYGGNADDDGSSSSGELRGIASGPAKSPPPPRRRRSYGDVLAANGTGALRGRPRRRGDGDGGDEQQQQQAAGTPPLRRHEAPGYVSFEDVIGDAAFRDVRHGDAGVISDPLVRATSRLYACETVKPPRRRQRSPGPLGTRRGSAMHGVVKNYVHPFFGFIAGIFCCAIPS